MVNQNSQNQTDKADLNRLQARQTRRSNCAANNITAAINHEPRGSDSDHLECSDTAVTEGGNMQKA